MQERCHNLILIKAGKLIKSSENTYLLISNSGKAYSTNIIIIEIWSLCNGNNSTEYIISSIKQQFGKVKKNEIKSLIEKLLSTQLIELL